MDYSVFCGVKCRPVTLYTDRYGDYYDDPLPGQKPTLWCVYGIYNNSVPRGSNCLADFATQDDAINYANELAGRHGWQAIERQ